MTELEKNALEIIGASGDSRGEAFKALRFARNGDIDKARESLKISKEKARKGHEVQTKLIMNESKGEKTELSLLMIHAQDHLMTSLMAYDLIEEIVEMCANKNI